MADFALLESLKFDFTLNLSDRKIHETTLYNSIHCPNWAVYILCYTVGKFHAFSVTQILREITFDHIIIPHSVEIL